MTYLYLLRFWDLRVQKLYNVCDIDTRVRLTYIKNLLNTKVRTVKLGYKELVYHEHLVKTLVIYNPVITNPGYNEPRL